MKVRKKLVPKDKGCLSQPFKWPILPACLRSIFIIGVVARTDDQRIPSIITSQICCFFYHVLFVYVLINIQIIQKCYCHYQEISCCFFLSLLMTIHAYELFNSP